MYGLTRATVTLIASAIAGFLIWLATQIGTSSNGDYWASYGVIAAAGLVMALSQLLGGWTKWGWPRISLHVFLVAFVPVAIAVVWIVIFHQPHHGLGRNHIRNWSNDIGIDGFVRDFTDYVGVLAFGLGLVFGYSFDTTGPIVHRQRSEAPAEPMVAEKTAPAPPPDAPPRAAPPREAPPRETPPREAPPPE
jgi:drug/metabolite transporter superfamily protein YnfA